MVLEHKKLDLFQKMIFEKARLKAPYQIANAMPNEACFLYVLKGEQRIRSAVEQLPLGPHEAVLMKCGLYFSEWLENIRYEECEAVAVHFYPDVLKKIYEREIPAFIRQAPAAASMHKIAAGELIRRYIDSLLFYFENPDLVSEELIVLKLKEIILLLSKTENGPSIIELVSSLFSPAEYDFKDAVEANLYTSLNVEQQAGLANMSLSSFKRKFADVYQESPARYLKRKKLERAADRIAYTDQRITTSGSCITVFPDKT